MFFRKKQTEDDFPDELPEEPEELTEEEYDDDNGEKPHGSGYIILPIVIELAFAGLLFLKNGTAALHYLYALIPILLGTSLVGTYVYNRDGDMKLFSSIAILTTSGVAFQMLADQTYPLHSEYSIIKFLIGFLAAIFFVLFYRILRKLLNHAAMTWAAMLLCACIYIALLIWGFDPNGYGTTAWLSIGGFTLQMTDFTKIAAIFFYASLFTGSLGRSDHSILNMANLFMAVNVVGSLLIHELGSLFILFFLHLSILYIFMNRSMRKRTYMLVIFFSAFLGVGICFALYKSMLSSANAGTLNTLESVLWPVVKKVYVRFSITANIQNDPYGAGYQLLQGKKALWTAGLFGNTVHFSGIPLAESDMAFPAFVSLFGFAVGLPLFLLFTRIFIAGSEISRKLVTENKVDAIVVYGASVLIFLQGMIVILGSCNVIPFTGLPIPFLSRGGTYQMIVFCFCGLLLNMSENDGCGPMEGGYYDDEEA